jgi:hypothetical protein
MTKYEMIQHTDVYQIMGFINQDKTRVVFNRSAKSTGVPLNPNLLQDQNLADSLTKVLVRFWQ